MSFRGGWVWEGEEENHYFLEERSEPGAGADRGRRGLKEKGRDEREKERKEGREGMNE